MYMATGTIQKFADMGKKTLEYKARIHTWLAWHDEPGLPVGTAITSRILSTDNDLCQCFVDWLERLFECAPGE